MGSNSLTCGRTASSTGRALTPLDCQLSGNSPGGVDRPLLARSATFRDSAGEHFSRLTRTVANRPRAAVDDCPLPCTLAQSANLRTTQGKTRSHVAEIER